MRYFRTFHAARRAAIHWGPPLLGVLLLAALACGLEVRQTTQTLMLYEERVQLRHYLDGSIERPLAFRLLVPQTVRLLTYLTPESLAAAIERRAEPIGRRILPRNLPPEPRRLDYYYLVAIQLLSLAGYALLGSAIYYRLFPRTPVHWLTPAGFLAVLVPFIAGRFGHIYDFTVLLLVAAMLHAIVSHRHRTYLLLFCLACCNKETAIFVSVGYACYFFDRMPRRTFLASMTAQAIIYLTINFALRYHFAANAGALFMVTLGMQLDWIAGRTFPEYMAFLAVLFLIAYRFDEKPLVLRRLIWMAVANAAVFFVMANIGEWRNFYETLPLLAIFVVRNVSRLGTLCFPGLSGKKLVSQDVCIAPPIAPHFKSQITKRKSEIRREE